MSPLIRSSIAAFALGVGASALAQSAPPVRDAANQADSAQVSPRPDDRHCLRSTGSLIPPKPGACLPVAGRSYSQDDLRRTGAFTTAEALDRLDPSITIHGH